MATYKQLPISVPSLFTEIVDKVSNELEDSLGKTVKFKHGTWLHLVSRLVEEQKGIQSVRENMYPLICLIHDFEERVENGNTFVSLDFVILTPSKQVQHSEDRYNTTIIPILYPIYAEFIEQIKNYEYFLNTSQGVKHNKIDALHFGENSTAYKVPDVLDGLIIKGLELTIDNERCALTQNRLLN